jgi:hypothetical protein
MNNHKQKLYQKILFNKLKELYSKFKGRLIREIRDFEQSETDIYDSSVQLYFKEQFFFLYEQERRILTMVEEDIAKSLFRTLAAEGLTYAQGHFRSLGVRYVRMAEDTIARHYADAMLNGLHFDRHAEELAVATFAKSLQQAAQEFTQDPLGLPLIPNWNRVLAAMPEFFSLLLKAVEEDMKMASTVAA